MTIVPPLPAPYLRSNAVMDGTDFKLREAAQKLETTFLSEMLKSTGFGATSSAFGGGIGEDQFSSFLRDAQAQQLTKAGGIGLAEALFEAMKVRAHA